MNHNRLNFPWGVDAYIDGLDGLTSSSPRTFFHSNGEDMDQLKPLVHSKTPIRELPNGGKVTLVGAGPGDPDLLTLSAHRIITDPSVMVIADRLVSPEILQLIQGECRIARKLPGCAEEAQDEVSNSFLVISVIDIRIMKRSFDLDLFMGEGRTRCWKACCSA
jgi:hypothetical protein